jgi:DNA-binding LacI/PurR family transcriptional regulator
MAATIREIADIAGVSPATVSFVLNDKPGVGQETRDKVLGIAAKLGYEQKKARPSPLVHTRTTRLLRIVKHGHIINQNHRLFISDYIDGLEKEAKSQDYRLEVQTIEGFDPVEVLHSLDADSTDGVVVLGTELDEDDMEIFVDAPVPIVIIDTIHPWLDLDFVDMNNESSVRAVIEHLRGAGHRRIGLVKGLVETRNFRLRERAFLDVMDRFGLPVASADRLAVDSTFDEGREGMARLLANARDLPTAFFCVNDVIAYACIQALKDSGRAVPGDVSIIGFDNLPSDDYMEPRLTSVKVSNRSIGRRAMRLLLDRIADPGRPSEKVTIGGELVVRDSVRPASGKE